MSDNNLLRFNKTDRLMFLDFETQNVNLHHSINLPWQAAFITIKGDNEVNRKNIYVKWPEPFEVSVEAARITKYSKTKVDKLGIDPEEAWKCISDEMSKAKFVVGHNFIGFDTYIWRSMCERLGKPCDSIVEKLVDTAMLRKGQKLEIDFDSDKYDLIDYQYKILHYKAKGVKFSLSLTGKECEIEHDYANLHDAMVDLELNIKIWNKLKWEINI